MNRIHSLKGRRAPGVYRPPTPTVYHTPVVPHPPSSSFPPPNPPTSTNGNDTPNSQAGFLFGQPSNGVSQGFNQPASTNTFPPASNGSTNFFGSSNQNPFSTQFIPPSSSFDFNSAQTVKNPFSNDPANGNNRPTAGLMEGYQGSIFSIPGYAPGLSDNSLAPPEAPASTFKFGPSQGDPAKAQSSIFSTNTGLGFGSEKSSTSSQNPVGEKQNIFGQPKASSSLFNQNSPFPSSQPNSQQPISDLFGQSNIQKSPASAIAHPTAPTPTPTEALQSQAFALQYEESMSTSPDHSPQGKGQGYSAPFTYPNLAPVSSSNGNFDSRASEDSLFGRISQPAAATTVKPAPVQESSQGDNQNSPSRNDPASKAPLFTLPPAPPAPREAKARSPEASPTKSSKQSATPNFAKPRLEEAKSATSNLFASIKLPPTQPSGSRAESGAKLASTLSNTPSQSSGAARSPEKEKLGSSDAPSLHDLIQKSPVNGFCWFRAPPPSESLSDEEQRQVIIGYQLKCLDAGVKNFLETRSIEKDSAAAERFYGNMKQDILDGKGLVLDPLAGSKRRHQNSELEDEHQEEANNKRARVHPPTPNPSAKPAAKTSSGAFAPNSFPKPSGGLFSQSTTVNSLFTPKSSAKPPGGFSTSSSSAKPSATFAAPNSSAKPASGFSFTSTSAANPSVFSFTPNPASTPSSAPAPVATPAQHAASAKRKALEDHDKSKVEGANNSVKRARAQDSISYPSLSSSTGSQTSSIFKNILDKKGEEDSPSAREPQISKTKAAHFDFNSTTTLTPMGSSQEHASTQVSKNGAQDSSIINLNGPSSHTLRESKLLASFSQSSSSTPTIANPFSSVTATSAGLFSNKTPQPASSSVSSNHSFQTPSIINNNASDKLPQPISSKSGISNNNSSNENARPSHPDKPSTSFAPPKFGAPVNFLSQFGKAAEETAEKEKKNRKAEDFDSDEDNEEDWERKYDEEQKAKKRKLEEAAKTTATKFIPGVGFKFEKPGNEKEVSNKSQPSGSIVNSSITSTPATSGTSVLTKPRQTLDKQQNIFAHLSDADSGQDGSKTGDADDEDEDEDSVSDQDAEHAELTEVPKAEISSELALKPNAAAVNPFAAPSALFTKKLAEKTDNSPPTGSLVDRISKPEETMPIINPFTTSEKADDSEKPLTTPNKSNPFRQSQGLGSSIFGKPTSSGSGAPLFGESSHSFSFGSGTFGKASPAAPVAPMFGSNKSPSGDNTWKVDSPIKFASSDNPQLKVTSPSPSKSPLGGLFGSPTANTTTEPSVKPTGIFSQTPSKDPSGGFGFAFGGPPKLAQGNLALPSGLASNTTSRATSPGATTGGESAAESNAGEDKDETTKDPQLDLAAAGPGEEHEDVLFTVKAKAMIYTAEKKTWLSKGVGMLRVLKHRDSKKTRILMRQDPSGKIVLNAALVGTLKYEYSPSKVVKMAIPTDTGKLSTWLVRVGEDKDAMELAKILEAEKKN